MKKNIILVFPIYLLIFSEFLFGFIEKDKKVINSCKNNFFNSLKLFEKILSKQQFLTGKDEFQVEDLYLFVILRPIFKFVINENMLNPFVNLKNWYINIGNSSIILNSLGKSQINKSNKSLL